MRTLLHACETKLLLSIGKGKNDMELVPHAMQGTSLMLPSDWKEVAPVLSISGSVRSGYQGWVALTITPDVLALITPEGIEEIIPLWSIEDVSVVKFDGILIERATSIGRILSPLPYPHGIEVIFSMETRLKLRLRLVTMVANHTHALANDIRRAAYAAQTGDLPDLAIVRR